MKTPSPYPAGSGGHLFHGDPLQPGGQLLCLPVDLRPQLTLDVLYPGPEVLADPAYTGVEFLSYPADILPGNQHGHASQNRRSFMA